jgi:hypothetical protein
VARGRDLIDASAASEKTLLMGRKKSNEKCQLNVVEYDHSGLELTVK